MLSYFLRYDLMRPHEWSDMADGYSSESSKADMESASAKAPGLSVSDPSCPQSHSQKTPTKRIAVFKYGPHAFMDSCLGEWRICHRLANIERKANPATRVSRSRPITSNERRSKRNPSWVVSS